MTNGSRAGASSVAAASPPVCVYVITYNGMRFLDRCFETLRSQTDYANMRLILIDNGSSDGSADHVLSRYPGVEVHRISPNAGYARAANTAIAHARESGARYVALMDDDIAILHSDWLREAISRAESDARIGIISFFEAAADNVTVPDYGSLMDVRYFNGFAMVMPMGLFDDIGTFDEEYFTLGEEDDLGTRAVAAGYRVVTLNIPIYHFGGGTNRNYSRRTAYLQMRNGVRYCLKSRGTVGALLRVMRTVDVACNPWPLTFDANDPAHGRMRNSGNLLVNTSLLIRAVGWNLLKLPRTMRIRAAERRLIHTALTNRSASNGA